MPRAAAVPPDNAAGLRSSRAVRSNCCGNPLRAFADCRAAHQPCRRMMRIERRGYGARAETHPSPAGSRYSRAQSCADTARRIGTRTRRHGAADPTHWLGAPPKRSSPEVISVNPAIMRNSVDLPQPEGPSSTRNSPSWNRGAERGDHLLLAEILGDCVEYQLRHGLSLHRAGGEPGDDFALDQQEKHDRRQAEHQRRPHDGAHRRFILPDEGGEPDAGRP